MGILTLTTDMGHQDHYVAVVKGKILTDIPSANIIDISHNVSPFDILEASFLIKNVLKDFPSGTIHIIGVDPEPVIDFKDETRSSIPKIVVYNEQIFIGNDSGIFSLILEHHKAQKIYRITDYNKPEHLRFPTKSIFADVACRILNGEKPEDLGEEIDYLKKAISIQPVIEENMIRGSVIYIDHYGNAITNITEKLFKDIGKGNPFILNFKSEDYVIDEISKSYNDVSSGEKLALFSSTGHLEIAINKGVESNGGSAVSLLGLRKDDIIRVRFQPKGSAKNFNELF
ncbi:MAG: SAM-dependent chlorinase/fluorinase [Crocinitomicaceae bacterium]|nr:SAM-dependent chlorinase/fluorinase [Crocinitomicaceae bacterium]